MLTQHTLTRLRSLKLDGMARAFEEQLTQPASHTLAFEERFGLLVDRESAWRDTRRLERLLKQARLKFPGACLEDLDTRAVRGLDARLMTSLGSCDWVRAGQSVIATGATGLGKSWLACALGHKACRDGFSVLYKRAPRLFADLAQARGEGRLARLMTTIERTQLLIIDDWGPEPLTSEQRRDLLEIVDDRYDKGSLLITSQVPVARWHDVIADPTLGDAILDRVLHTAHRLELKGDSLRRRPPERSPS